MSNNSDTTSNFSNIILNIPSNLESPTDMAITGSIYCNLTDFKKSYRVFHWHTALIVCVLGFAMNTANIFVLAKMDSKITSVNIILTGLALVNNVVNVEYVPYALGNLIFRGKPHETVLNTCEWATYVLFHAHASQVCYTISIWLTLLLALWHYISVAHPLRARQWCTRKRACIAVLAICITAPFACISFYLSFAVNEKTLQYTSDDETTILEPFEEHNNKNITLYFVGLSSLATGKDNLLMQINLWILGIVNKLVPCLIMTILSFLLIRALEAARKQRTHLRIHIATPSNVPSTNNSPFIGENRHQLGLHHTTAARQRQQGTEDGVIKNSLEEDQIRMTRILLAILILFVITELPQGLLALLSWILGDVFNSECYHQLGDLMDILSLMKSSINFVLYCAMSRKFRTTFCRIFFSRWHGRSTSSLITNKNISLELVENNLPTGITAAPIPPQKEQDQLYVTSTV